MSDLLSLGMEFVYPPPPIVIHDGWRVKHKIEGGNPDTPPGMPEVTAPINPVAVPMTRAIQLMSFDLMRLANSAITEDLWTIVHHGDKAFTNNQGFGMVKPDGTPNPRVNYVTKKDIGEPLPKYEKCGRICGGSFIRGVADGGYLYCNSYDPEHPENVHGINPDGPMPDAETIIRNHWFVYAVSINSNGSQITHFPQGRGGPVLIPFIFRGTIRFPLSFFEKWVGEELPDPLRIYTRYT